MKNVKNREYNIRGRDTEKNGKQIYYTMTGDNIKPYIKDRVRRFAVMLAAAVIFAIIPSQAFAVSQPGKIYAEEALLGDCESGAVLFEQNSEERIVPASTTKIMTALLVIEAIERGELGADEKVMATQAIIDNVVYDASRVMPYIVDGEELTVREYLYCIMLGSDCVACDVLAQRVSGSVEEFVELMNRRAGELGCTETNFVNTHGYPVEGHYTNARSLFLIMRKAMDYPLFRELISTIKLEIPVTEKTKEVRKLYNSNWMIWNPVKIKSMYTRYFYPESIGGKTGSSKLSGHCLVSCAQKDGVTLIAVITGAVNEVAEETGEWTNRSFSESRKLFEWGFANYIKYTVAVSGSDAGSVQVRDGESAEVRLITAGEASVLLPSGSDAGSAETRNVFDSEASAPVSSGDLMGHMDIYYDGELRGSVGLVAAENVKRRIIQTEEPKKEEKKDSPGKTLPILIIATILIFMGTLLLYITNNKRIIIAGKAGGRNIPQVSPRSAEFFSGADRYPEAGRNGTGGAPVANRPDRPVSQNGRNNTNRSAVPTGAQRNRAVPNGAQRGVSRQAGGMNSGNRTNRSRPAAYRNDPANGRNGNRR